MKVILSYGSYFNYGKNYQIKFIYDNYEETIHIAELMNKIKSTKMFKFYYLDKNNEISFKNTNIYGGTNIPKDVLSPFIYMLLSLQNTTIIIANNQFSNYDQKEIENSINKLHINATLNIKEQKNYYIEFKITSAEQQNDIYQITKNIKELKHLSLSRINNILRIEFKDSIEELNKKEKTLENIISILIEQYNIILRINTYTFKERLESKTLQKALNSLNNKSTKETKYLKKRPQLQKQ